MHNFTCDDCLSIKVIPESGGVGYAMYDTKKICYECVAIHDKRYMNQHGKIILYYDGRKITNWPCSLVFMATKYKEGKHNIASKRIDVWFRGPSNDIWHGVQYGNNTQLLHCKRVKH